MKTKEYVCLFLLSMAMTGCTGEVDNPVSKLIPIYDASQLVYNEQRTVTEENGLTIYRDESGRATGIEAFLAGQDDMEKLMGAPTSFEDIRYLFPLSEGNEIRMVGQGENPPIGEAAGLGDLSHYPQYYENYTQYYKGVPIGYSNRCRINYFGTPQGKRMTYATLGPFIDVKNLNPTPTISERNARQMLADYLEVDRDDSWPCELKIKEYSTKKDGKIQRDVRLIYIVTGPYAPQDPDVFYYMAPHYYAEVDAHTSQLVLIYE